MRSPCWKAAGPDNVGAHLSPKFASDKCRGFLMGEICGVSELRDRKGAVREVHGDTTVLLPCRV